MLLMPSSRANKTNKIPSCMHNMILIFILFRILHFNESLFSVDVCAIVEKSRATVELLAWKNIIILILRFLQNEERRSIDERCIMESTIRRGWRWWFVLIRSVVVFFVQRQQFCASRQNCFHFHCTVEPSWCEREREKEKDEEDHSQCNALSDCFSSFSGVYPHHCAPLPPSLQQCFPFIY